MQKRRSRGKFWWKNVAEIAATLGMVGIFFLLVLAERLPLFFGGENYTLYAGTSSEEIIFTDTPFLSKLTRKTRGESATFCGNVYEKWKTYFSASLVFSEEGDGAVSYYLFSPLLPRGVLLSEGEVNLHVVVKKDRTVVGIPIIFGGY